MTSPRSKETVQGRIGQINSQNGGATFDHGRDNHGRDNLRKRIAKLTGVEVVIKAGEATGTGRRLTLGALDVPVEGSQIVTQYFCIAWSPGNV